MECIGEKARDREKRKCALWVYFRQKRCKVRQTERYLCLWEGFSLFLCIFVGFLNLVIRGNEENDGGGPYWMGNDNDLG